MDNLYLLLEIILKIINIFIGENNPRIYYSINKLLPSQNLVFISDFSAEDA